MRLYDRIGSDYARTRRADPRIEAAIHAALGDARSVVNVGAGAGSYEPSDRDVLAIEPSTSMRAQRPADAARCLDATAEALPLPDASFDAAMAVYTDFHWDDPDAGIAELVRVSRRLVVVLTIDRVAAERFWLTRDYLHGANDVFRELAGLVDTFPGPCEVTVVPIAHDCVDGFVQAFWRRPRRFLDERLRSTMATFDRVPEEIVQDGIERLRNDLDSGIWSQRNRELRDLEELDLGHRLVVWRHPPVAGQPTLV